MPSKMIKNTDVHSGFQFESGMFMSAQHIISIE
jgi:hypothetical protein